MPLRYNRWRYTIALSFIRTASSSVSLHLEFQTVQGKKRARKNKTDSIGSEMDETVLDDVLDDWFIESLKTYKDLHVYQLEYPTRVIDWTSERTVCVAGYRPSKSEILELHMPLKLLADENKSLCADRDFKVVRSCFTGGPIHTLKHVPGTRCIVTNDGLTSRLQLWDRVEDSNVIRKTGDIESKAVVERGSKIAVGSMSEPSVLHGSLISNIELTELSSGKSVYALETDNRDILSSLHLMNNHVFLACTCNGDLYVVDTRTPTVPQPIPAADGKDAVHWCMDVSMDQSSPVPACCKVARLSSSRQVIVSDLRDLRTAVYQAKLDLQTDGPITEFMNLSWAPALDNCIAVSGFNPAVQIYNTSTWSAESKETKPLFEHHGHMTAVDSKTSLPAFITCHVWHPSRPRTVLSAATDGSVHVWDWIHKTPPNL